jgi:hypothetical protein
MIEGNVFTRIVIRIGVQMIFTDLPSPLCWRTSVHARKFPIERARTIKTNCTGDFFNTKESSRQMLLRMTETQIPQMLPKPSPGSLLD